jgi:hypothetical protein
LKVFTKRRQERTCRKALTESSDADHSNSSSRRVLDVLCLCSGRSERPTSASLTRRRNPFYLFVD